MTTATVFNIQRFSLHDGPGIRTTVFLKGCPLRCLWCHNPESMDPQAEPSVAGSRCLGCELCAPVCDHGLTGRVDLDPVANRPTDLCERCGQCAEVCPTGAREMLGRDYGAAELVAELVRDGIYHEESGEGVTFSGGEPLTVTNAQLVLECLAALKKAGVHTTIDTCGHVKRDTLARAADLADLFLFDLKLMDSREHRKATGQDNNLILENLSFLIQTGKNIRIRVPLVPGFTDSKENLEAMAAFLIEKAQGHELPEVHLLPYHSVAADKYQRLGRANSLANVHPMAPDEIDVRAQWLDHGRDGPPPGVRPWSDGERCRDPSA